MGDLIQQLSDLVLGSVPTMVLFLATLAAYRVLVHTPLTQVLRERYDRTEGAMKKAAEAVAAAEAKTAEYEERLRQARASIFRVRHERLHAIHLESERLLAEARLAAQERVGVARAAIDESLEAARLQIDGSIDELAAEALRVVLSAGKVEPQETV
jgi:F-type H+-transporting ATPase subunit b